MSSSDLLFLLREDLTRSFRLRNAKGKRTEKRGLLKRVLKFSIPVIVGGVILWGVLAIAPMFWDLIESFISENLGMGAAIFNAVLLFSFVGSIMISVTTVGSTSKMEYLLITPIKMRTIFLEKTIIVIFYNSIIWMMIGVPIFLGLSIVSPFAFALLSVPAFIIMLLILITIGVSAGGLIGLGIARAVAGRRAIKQIGTAIMSAVAIIGTTLYYVSFYANSWNGGPNPLDALFDLANSLGFTSILTPGYTVSSVTLGLLVGAPWRWQDLLSVSLFLVLGIGMVLLNSYVSEMAHYSGWLASDATRTSKEAVRKEHGTWNPRSFPGLKQSNIVTASLWFNITSVRRDARVITNYLLGPIRFAIFLVIPGLAFGDGFGDITSYFILAALIPFATSYGLYFAGYELVYEGANIMNLQLAATNLEEYVRGKVYSAVPFAIIASVIVSIIVLFVSPLMWVYLPAVIVACTFLCMASGGIAANQAAKSGDFKADRSFARRRGAAIQTPLRGWSSVIASIVPYAIGYAGVFGMILAGVFFGVLYTYVILPVFILFCWRLTTQYTRSAGLKLAQIDATKYL
ncbi:MAG: hypothetical protein KAW94_02490 [Candidatus Thorarchaeota archaeon]|nr:hypothetical protein [Candidatus Thorarchaeota archaeon]